MVAPDQPRMPRGAPGAGRWTGATREESSRVLGLDASPAAQGGVSPELVKAREVLLDALEALEEHHDALMLVGAQAVFEHTKHFSEAPPTLTTDSDMGVDPDLVTDEPSISERLKEAGFGVHNDRPGVWVRTHTTGFRSSVDLLAPESLAGSGRRSARIDGQSRESVGRAAGLEMALLDRSVKEIKSFTGDRSVSMYVAGPAALLCAKAYKLAERIAEASRSGAKNRVRPKDAGDVWRLMATTDPGEVRRIFDRHEDVSLDGEAISLGRQYLASVFGPSGLGSDLAVIDLGDSVTEERVRSLVTEWTRRFSG